MEKGKDNFIMLPVVDFCFKELLQNGKVRLGLTAALLGRRTEEIQNTFLLPTILQRGRKGGEGRDFRCACGFKRGHADGYGDAGGLF